ncbi:MAG: hypothetical protein AAB290_02940 [Candidatus Eisenbacteria bacterium]
MRVAIHESGHCAGALAMGERVALVTIVPSAGMLGHVLPAALPPGVRVAGPAVELTALERGRCVAGAAFVSACGEAAEQMIFGDALLGHGDRHDVADDAADVLDLLKIEPGVWARALHEAAERFVHDAHEQIEVLAVGLVRERTVTGARALEIVGGRPPAPDLRAVHGAIEFFAARRARARAAT